MKMKHSKLKIFICVAFSCKILGNIKLDWCFSTIISIMIFYFLFLILVGDEIANVESQKDESNILDRVEEGNIENLKDVKMTVAVQVVTYTKVVVNWTLGLSHHQYRQPHLEIIYSPVVARSVLCQGQPQYYA